MSAGSRSNTRDERKRFTRTSTRTALAPEPEEATTGESDGKILIVEDEEPIRNLIRITLERNGYSCLEADGAREARQRLQAYSCDLMLCDIRMPGESGLDLVRFVRTVHPDTAVIMVTGVDDMETAREAMSLDIYGYLLKPISRTQILISLANGLRRRQLEIQQKASFETLEKVIRERTLDLIEANELLKKREAELDLSNRELEEMNSALKVLLRKGESDRKELEESILANVRQTILPYVEKLKRDRLSDVQRRDLYILEAGISEIVSPFARKLSAPLLSLTPCEIQVAHLIKEGRGTKEIAAILNLSPNTVMTHRYRIRTKLGITNHKQNLRSYLTALP